MINNRFAEWTTSGAFALSLTRNQVQGLAMLEGGSEDWTAGFMGALERKGLAERLPHPTSSDPDRFELRPTLAGLLNIALLKQAGLVKGSTDAVQDEFAQLRAETVALRAEAAQLRQTVRAAMARKIEADDALDNMVLRRSGGKMRVNIRPRDPIPDVSDEELLARAQEHV
jgi:hypothetical protein